MRISIFAGHLIAAMALLTGAAQAQNSVFYSPEVPDDLYGPTTYEGLYAGVMAGPISARKDNFVTSGAQIRPEIGAVVGWNQPVVPGVVIGGELQATVATDFKESSYIRAMALARLGFAAGDNSLIYLLGGIGRVGERWAYEAGIGAEAMVTENMGLRLEAAGIGQLGDVAGGPNIPAISALRVSAAAIWQLDGPPASTRFTADTVTRFTGVHAGLNFGSLTDYQFNFFDNYGWGWHLSRFELGAFAGYTHALNDVFRAGVEAQVGASFDTSGDAGLDVLALGRLGVVPMERLHVYAAGGVGLLEGEGAYAYGGGAEYALWGTTSLRAEGLVLNRMDGVAGPSSHRYSIPTTKVTLGAVWHFD